MSVSFFCRHYADTWKAGRSGKCNCLKRYDGWTRDPDRHADRLAFGHLLAEYGKCTWLGCVTRFINDILLSAPSIVIGLFVYAIYVAQIGRFSAMAGAIALALIVIPVVVRTTENMLQLVPNTLREAAFALGAPRWKVITKVTVRASSAGIVTGVLLAVPQISGETAPLLLTALSSVLEPEPE